MGWELVASANSYRSCIQNPVRPLRFSAVLSLIFSTIPLLGEGVPLGVDDGTIW